MTEFLDGVRDGVKGEVVDLTTVNFDAMELKKLLVERNGWSSRLAKLEQNKTSVNAEIWKKLRNEYDQKLKARENELLTLRDKMRKKLDEMGKLKDAIEREFPGLQKRREELQLRYELGDFNQEFFDYVNRELSFQIDVRQKKVEVLSRNMTFYREALGSEDGVFAAGAEQVAAGKESDDSEAFGKGGSGPPQAVHAEPEPTWRAVTPPRPAPAAAPAQAAAPPVAVLEAPAEEAPEPAGELAGEPAAEMDEEGLENLPSDEVDLDEVVTPTENIDEPALEAALSPQATAAMEEAEEEVVVEEVEEEEMEPPPGGRFVNIPEEEADEVEAEEPAAVPQLGDVTANLGPAAVNAVSAVEEIEEVEELEEEVQEDLSVEEGAYLDSVGKAGGGLDTEEHGLLMEEEELTLGDESLEVEEEATAEGRTWGPEAHAHPAIDAMEDMSDALARGAEADPEREEAKKILEEVNLEELERAVEGIEGDGEDEELRGFVRDVSGRRGDSTQPPPAVLEVVEGINLGKVFPVSRTSSVTSIGKAPDNTIAMPEDKALSRYHAKIVYRQNKFVILDLDSTNGTGVNGEAVSEADLQDEDEIIMGGSRYIFRITSRA